MPECIRLLHLKLSGKISQRDLEEELQEDEQPPLGIGVVMEGER